MPSYSQLAASHNGRGEGLPNYSCFGSNVLIEHSAGRVDKNHILHITTNLATEGCVVDRAYAND